jgi:hypothetical protein
MNSSCFWRDKILINSSADISDVRTQLTWTRSVCIFCFNQWRCMSTCFNLMSSLRTSFFRIRSVWRLSHRMWSVFIESNCIISIKHFYYIVFLAIRVRINNSVSILDVMTIVCFAVLQFMKSSYSWNKYSSKLLRIASSSANVALLTQSRMFVDRFSKYSIAKFLISYK